MTFVVERYPGPNEKCSSLEFSRRPGGQGVNMAIVAARLGADCALISKVGGDHDGELVLAELARYGILSTGVIRQADGRTPIVSVIVDRPQATRACVHDKTGISPLAIDEIDLSDVPDSRFFLLDGRFAEVCLALADLARAHRARVVVTIERMTEQNRRLASLADTLIMPGSLVQAENPGLDIVTSGHALRSELGVPNLIATLGADGCTVSGFDETLRLNGFPADVSDTVGAGDAFAAATTVALAWGWTVSKAAEFGNYVGARACEGSESRWERIPSRPTAAHALELMSQVT